MSKKVLTIGPNKGIRVYKSICDVSRTLSGNGSTDLRFAIAEKLNKGGGYVGSVYVTNGTEFTQ